MKVQQFNALSKNNRSLIRKALDSSSAKAEALVPEFLEKVITNTVMQLRPELAMITAKFGRQKTHEFNQITSLPASGSAMGEGATTPVTNSVYSRQTVDLKIMRRKGAVTNFLQDASGDYIDSAAAELENQLLTHSYDLCGYITHGNAGADEYTHSGLDTFISTYREQEVVAGVVPTSLSFLDDMIDSNLDHQGAQHNKAFIMSPQMLSKTSKLLTNIHAYQTLGVTEVPGGWRLSTYRDIPIIVSSAMRPRSKMGTISTATATTGGTIPSSTTYYFRVSAVTNNGEQGASTEVNQATGSGTETNTITLSWTAVTGALYYKIYGGTSTGAVTLVDVIAAVSYDGNGTRSTATTSWVLSAALAANSDTVSTAMEADLPLNAETSAVPTETVILWDLDEFQGLGKYPYTNVGGSKFGGLVTIEPLAKTDDFLNFLIKTYGALCNSYEATSGIHRGLKVA
jgi:hypothetical protein